jgi:spermidine synthase
MYGGTVTQYGITIGLFFSSLGIGSYIAQNFDNEQHENFFRTEIYLAIAAPVGFLFIIWLNTANGLDSVPVIVTQFLARFPVVVIGVLSGFELPLLLGMVDAENTSETKFSGVNRPVEIVNRGVFSVTSMFFHTDTETEEYDTYSTVLAMDYLGGLGGALLFVFYLYPDVGLIASIFILALLNGVAALLFVMRFSTRKWGLFTGESRVIRTQETTAMFLACLILTSGYAGIAVNHSTVSDEISTYYTERLIEEEYPTNVMDVDVTSQYRTQYQEVTEYERTWVGDTNNRVFNGSSETCMRLDNALQLCESWVDSYHHGLVDVPMSAFENPSEQRVLLVGGGDWIAVNELREYNVSVDQVDLDGEFMENMKTNELAAAHHDDAYTYENLTTHQQDIYTYLQKTDAQYDLILLDLPGAKSDSLLHLYSSEFYKMLNNHLTSDGMVGTWAYSEYTYGKHSKVYLNTVSEAGFDSMIEYHSYNDFDDEPDEEFGERFLLFAPEERDNTIGEHLHTTYMGEHSNKYSRNGWRETPTFDGIGTNSIFKTNNGMIINDRLRAQRAS